MLLLFSKQMMVIKCTNHLTAPEIIKYNKSLLKFKIYSGNYKFESASVQNMQM